MKDNSQEAQQAWAEKWLDAVSSGVSTMSQRKLTAVEEYGGGLQAVSAVASQKGVHLVQLTDDKGNELIAASTHPFTVIC